MKTTSDHKHYKEQYFKLVMIVLLTILGMYSCSVHAQHSNSTRYMGLEGSFGGRYFTVNSNIQAINHLVAGHEGGSFGIMRGNEVFKTRINLGYYSSNSNNPRTQDIYEAAGRVNFYPLEFIRNNRAMIHPYITAGTNMTTTKFYGTYLNTDPYNNREESLLGKVSQYTATGGLGLEMRLEGDRDFVHFFAEAISQRPFMQKVSNAAFEQTTLNSITSFNVGISFGRKKF